MNAVRIFLNAVRIFWWVALACTFVACGDDDASDAGPAPDVGSRDSAVATCTGLEDGTVCGESQICLDEVCLNSRCGDGYVDAAADEVCDDGNEISGDGCEPSSCEFSCTDGEDTCDDGDPCNGTESCDVARHRCQAGADPTEETACE